MTGRRDRTIKPKTVDKAVLIDGVATAENRIINHFFHDFKAKCATIVMSLDAVMDGCFGPLGKNQIDLLDVALHSCSHMVMLINNFRDVTQMEEGTFEFAPETVNLEDSFNRLTAEITDHAKYQEVELRFSAAHPLPEVTFRADLFHRLVWNLCDVFLQSTRKKGLLQCRFETDDQNLSVKITTQGVPQDERLLPTVFDKLAQSETGLQLGRGFRLLFCKRAVELMGGRIELASLKDGCTQVQVWLPLETAPRDH